MPYVRKGKTVYKKTSSGKLVKKGSSSSVEKAKEYMKTLQAIHHGFKPTRKSKSKKKKGRK